MLMRLYWPCLQPTNDPLPVSSDEESSDKSEDPSAVTIGVAQSLALIDQLSRSTALDNDDVLALSSGAILDQISFNRIHAGGRGGGGADSATLLQFLLSIFQKLSCDADMSWLLIFFYQVLGTKKCFKNFRRFWS